MTTRQNVLTPTARMLWGSVSEPQTKDAEGKPLVIKSGPNAGQATQRYAFGVGIPKGGESHWSQTSWGAAIWAVGHAAFPNVAQRPDFAWKVIDGDSTIPNKRGKAPNTKEGYPGHWVLSFSSSYPPRLYNRDGSQPLEPAAFKCGYFVQVAGTVDGNDSPNQPGVYLNHNMVALQGYGPEIISGPDPTSVGFGGGPAPAMMSATPPAGMVAPPAVPGAPMAPPAPPPPPAAPVAAPVAAPAVPTAVAPAPAFLGAPAAPPPPVAAPVAPPPPPPAAVPVRQMTAKAAGATFEQMVAAGWNEAQLRQHGYLV
jgi:hypothetical protein